MATEDEQGISQCVHAALKQINKGVQYISYDFRIIIKQGMKKSINTVP